jgi:hypothetical protein
MFLKYITSNRYLVDEPGGEGSGPSELDDVRPFSVDDAFEKAHEDFAADWEKTEDERIAARPVRNPAPAAAPAAPTPESTATPPAVAQPPAASPPSAPPAAPTQAQGPTWEQQRQLMQAMAAMQRQPEPAQTPEPEKPHDFAAGFTPPERAEGMDDDAYAAQYMARMMNHVGPQAERRAHERAIADFRREAQPMNAFLQNQEAQRRSQAYEGGLKRAISAAGYKEGTPQFDMVRSSLHGAAVIAHQQRQRVDDDFLTRTVSTYVAAMPPVAGPQAVVDAAAVPVSSPGPAANAPLTGAAPGGSAAPAGVPTAEPSPPKNLDEAGEAFERSLKNMANQR